MVTVRLQGGLGNQMFQYALGRHLAFRNKTELLLDATFLHDPLPHTGCVPRRFDLGIFELPVQCTILSRIAATFPLPRVFDYASRGATRLKSALGIQHHYRESSFRYDERVLAESNDICLEGYWQSEKYFRAISDTIRQDFTIRGQTSRVLALGDRIAGMRSVCVNVRRGDFTGGASAKTHGVVGLEYYCNALRVIADQWADIAYFVFSDDIAWCKTELVPLLRAECTLVTHEYAGPRFRDYLWLMSQCTHFVIPNSTFGWWAAWLGTAAAKSVIAPSPWFLDKSLDAADLLPTDWIQIPRTLDGATTVVRTGQCA